MKWVRKRENKPPLNTSIKGGRTTGSSTRNIPTSRMKTHVAALKETQKYHTDTV